MIKIEKRRLMSLKINQTVSKDAQARTLLKDLLKVHQIHQAYQVRDLTDADEQILEKSFYFFLKKNKTIFMIMVCCLYIF